MKSRIINKHNLELAKLCTAEESRYALCGIQITERESMVTDGHILARVTLPDINPEHFPAVPGLTEGEPGADCESFVMAKQAALDIAKAIPARTGRKRAQIPVLQNAIIDRVTENEAGRVARVGVTDLDTPQVFNSRALVGQFPNADLVCPKRASAQFKVSFNLRLLIPLLQQMNAFLKTERTSTVEFSFYGDQSPMRLDAFNPETGQNFMGVIMPIRSIGDGAEYNYPGFDVPAVVTAEDLREIEAVQQGEETEGPQEPEAVADAINQAIEAGADDEADNALVISYGSQEISRMAGEALEEIEAQETVKTAESDAGAPEIEDIRDEWEICADRAADLLMQFDAFTVSPFARSLWETIMADYADLMQWAYDGSKWSYPDDCPAQLDRLAARISADRQLIEVQPMMAGAIINPESAPAEVLAA